MRFLFFLSMVGLLFIAFTLLFGLSFLRMVLRAIFGINSNTRRTSSNQQKAKQTSKQTSTPHAKKIITREEGEYIDFEEIKD